MFKISLIMFLLLTACAKDQTEPKQLLPKTEIKNKKGFEIYQKNCIACHGNDGTGVIAGVPDLTKIPGFGGNSDTHEELFQHFEHVKNGLKRPGDPIAMPPKGGNPNLTDQDIKEVLEYMHEQFATK